jgi:hypothetical protein
VQHGGNNYPVKKFEKLTVQAFFPYIQPALHYLELTQKGKQIVANLYANVFLVENENRDA